MRKGIRNLLFLILIVILISSHLASGLPIDDFIEITEFTVPDQVYRGQVVTVNVDGYFYYHTLDMDYDCDDYSMDVAIAEDDGTYWTYDLMDDVYIDGVAFLDGSQCVWMGLIDGTFIQYRYPISLTYNIDFSSKAGLETELEILLYLEVDEPGESNAKRTLLNITTLLEDTIPSPTPSPNTDPSGTSSSSSVRVYDYIVTDAESGIDHYEYNIDNGAWYDIGTSSEFYVTLSDGAHNIYVKAVDKAGNTNMGSIFVYVDTSPCDCSSGECCDGCHYKLSGTKCLDNSYPSYFCDGNGLGSNVMKRTQYKECSGSSSSCFGSWYYNLPEVYRDCGTTQYCANDGDTSCTSCSTVCDYSCQSSTCYGIDPDCTSSGGSNQCNGVRGGTCSGGDCTNIPCGYDPGFICVGFNGCIQPDESHNYYICENTETYDYQCINGNMQNDDVFRRRRLRFCSGDSLDCTGPYGWGSFNKYQECGTGGRCANDGDTSCTSVSTEVCDGNDNDWDGDIDEGLTGDLCPLQLGECTGSRKQCVNGAWQSCSSANYGTYYESVETSCDTRDNDCDGYVDEYSVISCGLTDVGECSYGIQTCTGGQWSECQGAVNPSNEICDNLDNDCDSNVDDDIIDPPQCSLQQGVCEGSEKSCVGGAWEDCSVSDYGGSYEATEITCDGLDNDCDGNVDESSNNENCQYVCENNSYTWTNNGGNLNCCGNDANEGSPYQANERTPVDYCSDGSDNDCDGLIDIDDINCKSCIPNWVLNDTWSECDITDQKYKNWYDTNDCCAKTGLESDCNIPENVIGSCDYCTPDWIEEFTECQTDDTLIGYYIEDSNNCYAITGLESDNNPPANNTYSCIYDCTPHWVLNDTWSECGTTDSRYKEWYDINNCGKRKEAEYNPVKCWGSNNYGQSEDYYGSGAIQVSAEFDSTYILKSDGNVLCQGENDYGQSENYTEGDAIQVSVGGNHACILKSDGNVDCRGYNNYGQSEDYSYSDAVQVSIGAYHSCIMKSDGNIDCWGDNGFGQANDYNGGDAVQVNAGGYHTCILKSNGNVDCWGYSFDERVNDYYGGDAVQVSAGDNTCILKSSGNVDCRGPNYYGQSEDYYGGDAVQVSAGWAHTCILKSDNNVECWGDNWWGECEDYTSGDAIQVSAGGYHTCALIENKVNKTITQECDYCAPNWKEVFTDCQPDDTYTGWFNDTNDCYAITGLESDNNPPANNTYNCDYCTPNWVEIFTECQPDNTYTGWFNDTNNCYATTGLESDDNPPANNTYFCDYCTANWTLNDTWSECNITDNQYKNWYDSNSCGEEFINKSVKCWGHNESGQTKDYDDYNLVQVSTGEHHTCILKSDGNVDCWGNNDYAQSNNYAGNDAIEVSAGGYHTCILKSEGNVDCWGHNSYGQSEDYINGDAIQVSTGRYHTCVLKPNGDVNCWGNNNWGQSEDYSLPGVIQITTGDYFTCILWPNGNVGCWGDNRDGQSESYFGFDATQVSAGSDHTCILKSNRNVECRGNNDYSQSMDYYGGDAVQVSAGGAHTCILKSNGYYRCWGNNDFDQSTIYGINNISFISSGYVHTCVLIEKNIDKIITQECDYCNPLWNCIGYDVCQSNDEQYCNAVTDLYSCYSETSLSSDLYDGDYSEFSPESCDYCLPSWEEAFTECQPGDTYTGWFNDTNSCYAFTGLESDNNPPPDNSYTCDYCAPNWTEIFTECQSDDTYTGWFNDTNNCYAITGLGSDNNVPANNTYSCDYCDPLWSCTGYGNCLINDTKLCNAVTDLYSCYSQTGLSSDQYSGDYSEFSGESCEYCSPNPVNTSWTEWQNQTNCRINNSLVQKKNRTEYDGNYDSCYAVTGLGSDLWNNGNNNTYYDYQDVSCNYCYSTWENVNGSCETDDSFAVDYVYTNTCCADTGLGSDCNIPSNTTGSCDYCSPNWVEVNTSCMLNNTKIGWFNDTNSCYAQTGLASDNNPAADNTYSCDYCSEDLQGPYYTSYGSCLVNDTQQRTKYYVDNNYSSCCVVTGLGLDCNILTIYVNTTESQDCDYCSPNPVNTSWTAWEDQGSCLINDTQVQKKNRTEYDENYDSCYAVTQLEPDLWNNENNNTYFDYQVVSCNHCDSTWDNVNGSCEPDDSFAIDYVYTNTCCADTGLESDCNIPSNTTGSCDHCTPNWQEVFTDCKPDNSYTSWFNDTNDCYAITGLESDNNPPANNTYSCNYEWELNLTLNPNWNLISIPLTLEDNSVETALSSIEGKYESIFTYDSSTSDWVSDIAAITPEKGYWIKMTEEGILNVNGTLPELTNYSLKDGWNLIGYPSLTEQSVTTLLTNVNFIGMFAYNNSWLSYHPDKSMFLNTLQTMQPGYGYWIKLNEDTEWAFNKSFHIR